MSRPRTATAILDARGAFKKNPKRKRQEPEVAWSFPESAPADLDPLEVKWWHSIRRMVPASVLTHADQAMMIVAAGLMAEYMADRKEMATSRISLLGTVLGRFGLSPADRAKLSVEPDKPGGEFDEF